ncbi:MAG: hypothetical protein LZF84_01355, partial [Nitrosomonas sp.]
HRNTAASEAIPAGVLVTRAPAVDMNLAMGLRPPYPNKSHWLCRNEQVRAEACFCICIPRPCENKYDAIA